MRRFGPIRPRTAPSWYLGRLYVIVRSLFSVPFVHCMKVILINSRHGGSRSLEFGRWSRALVSLCCLGLPLGLVLAGYYAGQESEVRSMRGAPLHNLQDALEDPSGEFDQLKDLAQRRMQAMTLNLAELLF